VAPAAEYDVGGPQRQSAQSRLYDGEEGISIWSVGVQHCFPGAELIAVDFPDPGFRSRCAHRSRSLVDESALFRVSEALAGKPEVSDDGVLLALWFGGNGYLHADTLSSKSDMTATYGSGSSIVKRFPTRPVRAP
jgi:hypothetical protein